MERLPLRIEIPGGKVLEELFQCSDKNDYVMDRRFGRYYGKSRMFGDRRVPIKEVRVIGSATVGFKYSGSPDEEPSPEEILVGAVRYAIKENPRVALWANGFKCVSDNRRLMREAIERDNGMPSSQIKTVVGFGEIELVRYTVIIDSTNVEMSRGSIISNGLWIPPGTLDLE
jgi:hypothetical protein